MSHPATLLIEKSNQQMRWFNKLMFPPKRERLCILQRLLKLAGELVHSHGLTLYTDNHNVLNMRTTG